MPLYKLKNTGTESAWGIWKVEESAEELAFTAFEEAPEGIIHLTKRLEWLASRVLVRTLLEQNDLPYSGIHKDEFGKPFLRELTHHISLSHAYPYVAVQLDRYKSVGIDIEQPTEKLLRIAPRVLSLEELDNAGSDIRKHCVYWCAKEALYKVYGKRGLHFASQLLVEPFILEEKGDLKGMINMQEVKLNVALCYEIEPEFVVVYTNPH
ncbi:MAG: 4'-phosphopantetheinyl transferase superfamily protein [Cytophagales bacterium]|nr:4'-phosphopantetheinyl transferase superfamily protein [Cytophagales bacterium]MCA6366740.1 4'-phosphopantetheinyl transferase superfamily protein [Cytophagales bacterium]MCA6372753.1 4'-phosphopantetheinyl transferase superfamily protein [Cytophagales bacterium]MCA6377609.1 4'-phosphopantetheinyl transferase superfamily protein [Cytophagales bacterium]MCA6384776.1 4'-phosphopantetheinyl transferase superfamily protein [Cytophagales bacterium]